MSAEIPSNICSARLLCQYVTCKRERNNWKQKQLKVKKARGYVQFKRALHVVSIPLLYTSFVKCFVRDPTEVSHGMSHLSCSYIDKMSAKQTEEEMISEWKGNCTKFTEWYSKGTVYSLPG